MTARPTPHRPQTEWSGGTATTQANRWRLLVDLVRATDRRLSLWPGLLAGAPVIAAVGPATKVPMDLTVFLRSAVDHGAWILYGHYVDFTVDAVGEGREASVEHGLMIQYPVPGGVVHHWTAVSVAGRTERPIPLELT